MSNLKDTELTRNIESCTSNFRERAALYYLAHEVKKHGLKTTLSKLKKEMSPASVGRYKRTIENLLGKAEAKQDTVNAVTYLYRKLKTFTPVLPKKLDSLLGEVAETKKRK